MQLTDSTKLRLFRFAKDGVDEDSVQLDAPLNDDAWHHVTISKTGTSKARNAGEGGTVTVSVDGKKS